MKNYRILMLALVLAVLCPPGAGAKIYEKLRLRNGDVVEGRIVSQRPGSSITFAIERTTTAIRSDLVSESADRYLSADEWTPGWQQWAADHPEALADGLLPLTTLQLGAGTDAVDSVAVFDDDVDSVAVFVDTGADSLAAMADDRAGAPCAGIAVGDSQLASTLLAASTDHLVYVLERGTYIRYVDLTPAEYTFDLADIEAIERTLRQADALSGLDDIIETRNGKTYQGQIVEQILGKAIRLQPATGVVQNISNANIACQKKQRLNAEQTVVQQSPFLDVVTTSDTSYQGVITQQNYGTATTPSYLVVTMADGSERRVDVADVRQLARISNDDYQPLTNFIVEGADVYFNRQLVQPIAVKKNKTGFFAVSESALGNYLLFDIPDAEKVLTVEMADTDANQKTILLPVDKVKAGKQHAYVFSYEDLVNRAVPVQRTSVSSSGTLLREYAVASGSYLLYHPANGTVYFCQIQ